MKEWLLYSDWVIQYSDLPSEQKELIQSKRDLYEQDPTEVHLKELQEVLRTVGASVDKYALREEVAQEIAALGPIDEITLDTYSLYEERLVQIDEKVAHLREVWPNCELVQYDNLTYYLKDLFGGATSLEEALIERAHVALVRLPMMHNIKEEHREQVTQTRKYVNAALQFTTSLQNLWKLEEAEKKLKELEEAK